MSLDDNTQLRLRPVEPGDCALLWEWANDPEVRAAAFNTELIPWTDHVAWFYARLSSERSRILLAVTPDGIPIGQVRFDLGADGHEAEIDISIASAHRGRGLGEDLLVMACREYQRETGLVLAARVRPMNGRSMKIFASAGFVCSGIVKVRGSDVVRWERRPAEAAG